MITPTELYLLLKSIDFAPGATRTELSGVGDKAFYETVPGMEGTTLPPKVRLVAFKGNIYVVLSDSHAPADLDAKVKSGLTSFANMLADGPSDDPQTHKATPTDDRRVRA